MNSLSECICKQSHHRQLCENLCKRQHIEWDGTSQRGTPLSFLSGIYWAPPRCITAHRRHPCSILEPKVASKKPGVLGTKVTWSHYCFFFFAWGFLFRNCWKPEVIFLLVATGHTGIQNKQEFLSVYELTALSGRRLISVPLGQPIMRSSCSTTPLLLCHCAMWWPEKIIWPHERKISETVPSLGKPKMNFSA